MERLTYKTKNGWVGVHDLEDKNISPTSVAIRKLAEFEDFMEEQGFEDLEHLKLRLCNLSNGAKYYVKWQKLKSYLINTIKEKDKSPKYYKFREVLDKMQELEKE